MRTANSPFHFVVASYLTRICKERAWTLAELAQAIANVSEASIFYHTFQSLESHHYTSFSNDFAQWTMASCNEPVIAEQLAGVDLRDITSVEELRTFLVETVGKYLKSNPQIADRPAYEPFYFCEASEVVLPLQKEAYTLAELADGIRHMGMQTLHYHFINSRLRVPLRINDFSNWIETSLDLPVLGTTLNQIDIYMNTLEGVREEILGRIEQWPQ
jgi:hypothetical protein